MNISDGKLDRTLKKKQHMIPPTDQRGKHPPANKTSDDKVNELCQFIQKIPSYISHYSRHKTERKYLAPDLNIRILYDEYKKTTNSPLSESKFRDIFNTKFDLHFHAPVVDSCKKCDSFQTQLKVQENEPDKKKYEELKIQKELHLRKASQLKDAMVQDSQIPVTSDTTVFAFDLMKTLPTPVISTGITYYKRQLWTYCLGVHNLQTEKVTMFVWDESVASRGSQEVGSCLLYYIKHFVKTKKVIMYSDGCGGQNRNIKMALLCTHVVQSEEFSVEEIKHNFLVSGHSFMSCDRDFGLIEKNKKFHPNIYIPKDWVNVILTARKKNPFQVIVMEKEHFFSTSMLERTITNRKISTGSLKVEWLKMHSILVKKADPFLIYFKYGVTDMYQYQTVNIQKRNALDDQLKEPLPILYPNENSVTAAKKRTFCSCWNSFHLSTTAFTQILSVLIL